MAKKKPDELLFHAKGTMPEGTPRHFSVYKHGAAVLVTSMTKGHVARHLCPTRVKSEEQIKREIALVFDVTDLTITRPRW